jgi:dolichol-phosphate mannosyltransferase
MSVVMAAYSEAENLVNLLPRLLAVLDQTAGSFEVLVVDSEQPLDATEEVCARWGVRHVRRQGGDTYGDAIRTGLALARGEWVVLMDADGSHDPEFIKLLWDERTGADVVIASRYVPGGSTENPRLLVAFSRLLNHPFAMALRMPARDVSNSFRLYRADCLSGLVLESDHFDIQEEILARLVWSPVHPARVAEVPFSFARRDHGSSKRNMPVFLIAFLRTMWRLQRLRRSLGSPEMREEFDIPSIRTGTLSAHPAAGHPGSPG